MSSLAGEKERQPSKAPYFKLFLPLTSTTTVPETTKQRIGLGPIIPVLHIYEGKYNLNIKVIIFEKCSVIHLSKNSPRVRF